MSQSTVKFTGKHIPFIHSKHLWVAAFIPKPSWSLNPRDRVLGKNLIKMQKAILDDWLTVHHSITFYHQLDAQTSCLFTYNTLIKILYMFRAYLAHLQEVHFVIVYMRSLVSSLSAGDCLVHRLRKISVLVYLSCLFSIANRDDWLTVHHSITFLTPTWCTNFLFIYIYIYTIAKWTSWRWAGYARNM